MHPAGVFFLVLFVVLIAAAAGWVTFTQLRARRLGLPAPTISSYNPFARSQPSPYGPPSPAPGGIRGWINDKFRSRNNRSAAGAYEQPLNSGYTGGQGRGFGPLDPDEAWDARVGNEAHGGYYEEQELGNTGSHSNPYGDSSYPMNLAATPGAAPPGFGDDDHDARGRSRDREGAADGSNLGVPGKGKGKGVGANPFDDDADPSNISMRGVSPRPIDTSQAHKALGSGPNSDSPTERKSMFRENV